MASIIKLSFPLLAWDQAQFSQLLYILSYVVAQKLGSLFQQQQQQQQHFIHISITGFVKLIE